MFWLIASLQLKFFHKNVSTSETSAKCWKICFKFLPALWIVVPQLEEFHRIHLAKSFIKPEQMISNWKMVKQRKILGRKATSAHRKRKAQHQQRTTTRQKVESLFYATLNCSRAIAKKLLFIFVSLEKSSLIRVRETRIFFWHPSRRKSSPNDGKREASETVKRMFHTSFVVCGDIFW